MAWSTSTRAKRLPPNWATIRRQVRARARGKCQAHRHAPGCNRQGAECDHISPGDNHDLSNLQWLSTECHDMKTREENAEANRLRARLRIKPAEKHPGLLD